MSESFVIRRLGTDDLLEYKLLRETVLDAHPEAFSSDASEARLRTPESYRARLGLDRAEGGEFTLGAWEDATLVGAIGCERDSRIKVRHIGHIVGMMVRHEHQGRGLGSLLLRECVAQARRASGLEMLTLSVTAGNESAVRLYERAGFIRYGSLPHAICVEGRYFTKDQMMLVL